MPCKKVWIESKVESFCVVFEIFCLNVIIHIHIYVIYILYYIITIYAHKFINFNTTTFFFGAIPLIYFQAFRLRPTIQSVKNITIQADITMNPLYTCPFVIDQPFSMIFLADIDGIVNGKNKTISCRDFGIPSSGHSSPKTVESEVKVNLFFFMYVTLLTTKNYHWIKGACCYKVCFRMRFAIHWYEQTFRMKIKIFN